jgi:hypothetical protein
MKIKTKVRGGPRGSCGTTPPGGTPRPPPGTNIP